METMFKLYGNHDGFEYADYYFDIEDAKKRLMRHYTDTCERYASEYTRKTGRVGVRADRTEAWLDLNGCCFKWIITKVEVDW